MVVAGKARAFKWDFVFDFEREKCGTHGLHRFESLFLVMKLRNLVSNGLVFDQDCFVMSANLLQRMTQILKLS